MKTIGFTRVCFTCDKKKVALGGTFNPRMKVWKCAGCSGAKMNWKKGVPPSIGWWPVKNFLSTHQGAYRWWDGEVWSWVAFAHESAEKAAHWAAKKELGRNNIEWTDRPKDWPERSKT